VVPVALVLLLVSGLLWLVVALANSGSDSLVTASVLGAEVELSSGRLFTYGVVLGLVGGTSLGLLLTAATRRRYRTRERKHEQALHGESGS
jgi:uncharacterized membrane protein